MYCSCDHAACRCDHECLCCPFMCDCLQCLELRKSLAAFCHRCGGYMPTELCEDLDLWRRNSLFPNVEYFRVIGHCPGNRSLAEKMSLQRSSAETTPSPPEESSSSDDSLQFPMDDVDFSAAGSARKSTRAKNQDFQCSSDFRSDERVSVTPPHLCGHSKVKWTKSAKGKMPIKTQFQKPYGASSFKLREPRESEMPDFTQDVAGCSHSNSGKISSESGESRIAVLSPLQTSAANDFNQEKFLEGETQNTKPDVTGSSHHNLNTTISKLQESQITEESSEHKRHAARFKCTQSHESNIIDVPGCSHWFTPISIQEEAQIIDSSWHTVSQSTDEYDSDSLHSNLYFDSPPSTFLFSKRSPSHPLSASAPATYGLSQPVCKLKDSEQNKSVSVGTQTSPISDSPKYEILKICDSEQIDKSTSSESSSSYEILLENMLNGEKQDALHGQLVIPSNSVESSQLNNSVLNNSVTHSESSQPGTSETLSTSNSP